MSFYFISVYLSFFLDFLFFINSHAFSLSPLRTKSVFVSFGKKRLRRKIEIASVIIFSGEIGSHKKAIYVPETAISQFILKYEPIAKAIYDHPFVIIHAIAMQSRSRGFVKNCTHFFIFCFVIFFIISPFHFDDAVTYYNRLFFIKNSLQYKNEIPVLNL